MSFKAVGDSGWSITMPSRARGLELLFNDSSVLVARLMMFFSLACVLDILWFNDVVSSI